MSKMSEISAKMDEENIPSEKRNSLINRVSAGMHAAEKKIDDVKPVKKPATKPVEGSTSAVKAKNDSDIDWRIKLANKVRKFADRTHNVITLNGKSYVKVGAYQFLAGELGVYPVFDCVPESTQTEVWCECELWKDGKMLTKGVMYADKREAFLRDKEDFAVLGMAQTRAFVRAMKNVYGYIMELAGYQSVAMEEISAEKERNNG